MVYRSIMGNLTFQWESSRDLIKDNIKDLVRQHCEEVEPSELDYEIDWDAIAQAEDNNDYGLVTVRRDGELRGWALFKFWYPSSNKNNLFTQLETICVVHKEPNRARLWLELYSVALDMLPSGTTIMTRLKAEYADRLGKVLERKFDMQKYEVVYLKRKL